MSEEPDKESKTEEATDKRREEALESGNTPMSREMSNLGFIVSIMIIGSWVALGASTNIASVLSNFIDHPAEFQLRSSADVAALLQALIYELGPPLAPLPLFILIVGVAFQVTQVPLQLSAKRIEPKLSRISLAQGWKRIASSTGLVELLKGIVKIGFLAGVGAWYLAGPHETMVQALDVPMQAIPSLMLSASIAVLLPVSVAVALMAVSDVAFSRFSWGRRLRMTRQQVKDEAKQSEGDQQMSFRRRAIARGRVRQMMTGNVPRATLVVTNPTHFAVALRYVRSEGNAPLVVAKGQDLIALQIRRIAERNGVPVVEDRALARSLFAAVEVNQPIPREFYSAVANIILLLRKVGNRHVIQALEA
jgi:flagellar biosynthetic protein FlhB